jgi:hypothetical protein
VPTFDRTGILDEECRRDVRVGRYIPRIIEGGSSKPPIPVRNNLSSARFYAVLATALLILVGLAQWLILARYDNRHLKMSAKPLTGLRYIVNWRTSLQYIVWDDQLFFRSIHEARTRSGHPSSPAADQQVHAPIESPVAAAFIHGSAVEGTCTFTPDRGAGWGLTWTVRRGHATPPLVRATWTGTVHCPWQTANDAVTVSQPRVWSKTAQRYGYNSAARISIDILAGTFSGTLPLSPIGPQLGDPTNWNGSWKIDSSKNDSDRTWTEHGTWTSSGRPNCCQ